MITYVRSTDPDDLRAAHRSLLVSSFRPGELLHEDEFIAQFADRAEAVLARDDEGRVLGVAVIEHFRDASLLQYLVAAPSSRGQGVGSSLLDAIITGWAPQVSVLLAEFDRPDVQAMHPLHGDPAARLRFYARFGALALDLPYFQPPVSAEEAREYGMLLAVFDTDGTIARRGRLTDTQSAAVRNYLDDILDDAEDRDAQRLRDAALARNNIRALPLSEYQEVPCSPLQCVAG